MRYPNYNYYEMKALKRRLTLRQQEIAASITECSYANERTAVVIYRHDFRAYPYTILSNFDLILHLNDAGRRAITFQIPIDLPFLRQIEQYCRACRIKTHQTYKHLEIELSYFDQDYPSEDTGEGWLDKMVGLYDALLNGDYRPLYLSWLQHSVDKFLSGKYNYNTPEPPVPSGLQHLSRALEAFVDFVQIDKGLIAIAAEQSDELIGNKASISWEDYFEFLKENHLTKKLQRELSRRKKLTRAIILEIQKAIHRNFILLNDAHRCVGELVEKTKLVEL